MPRMSWTKYVLLVPRSVVVCCLCVVALLSQEDAPALASASWSPSVSAASGEPAAAAVAAVAFACPRKLKSGYLAYVCVLEYAATNRRVRGARAGGPGGPGRGGCWRAVWAPVGPVGGPNLATLSARVLERSNHATTFWHEKERLSSSSSSWSSSLVVVVES